MLTNGELFAGISGFGLGLERAGIKTGWRVEIDPACQKLLRSKYPDDLLLSDVRKCGKHNLSYVDIISFGSPCQDLSVAGKREGLVGKRSGLFHEAVRIIRELKPKYVIWENVPGVFSSHQGNDFRIIISSLLDTEVPMPRSGRWATEGMARSGKTTIAWRVLDSRFFGVAQRRRRVFIVASFGNASCVEVLFELEGVSRDSAESGETGQGTAGITGTLSANRGGLDRPGGQGAELGFCIPIAGTLQTHKSGGWGAGIDTLGEFVPVAFQQNTRDEVRQINGDGQIVGALASQPGMKQQNYIAKAILRGGHSNNPLDENLIAFNRTGGKTARDNPTINETASLKSQEHLAIAWHENKSGQLTPDDTAKALRSGASHSYHGIGVRRLTPTECERLQSFPDGWTDGFADSVRYRMLGNAVTVNVIKWIGDRLLKAATPVAGGTP